MWLFGVVYRATVMDYLRVHDEKMLAQMGLDVNDHKSALNPWAGTDQHPVHGLYTVGTMIIIIIAVTFYF